MENNIGNFNKNINLDDPRIDFNKLLCTSVSGEQDSMNPSNSQFQVSSNPEKKYYLMIRNNYFLINLLLNIIFFSKSDA